MLTTLIVANAVGPWVGSYNVYTTGEVTPRADTPVWILIVAGLLLGLGFWGMSSLAFHLRWLVSDSILQFMGST